MKSSMSVVKKSSVNQKSFKKSAVFGVVTKKNNFSGFKNNFIHCGCNCCCDKMISTTMCTMLRGAM